MQGRRRSAASSECRRPESWASCRPGSSVEQRIDADGGSPTALVEVSVGGESCELAQMCGRFGRFLEGSEFLRVRDGGATVNVVRLDIHCLCKRWSCRTIVVLRWSARLCDHPTATAAFLPGPSM